MTNGFEVSPKSILDLASDHVFNELNVEPSLTEPSFIESSILESSTDSNVSVRRKNRKFLGEQSKGVGSYLHAAHSQSVIPTIHTLLHVASKVSPR